MAPEERLEAVERYLAELTRITVEHEERRAAAEERAIAAEERHERELAEIRATIRQAVLLGIREARQEHEKRRAADAALNAHINDLTAAIQRLADMRRGNGNPGQPG